MRRSGHYIFDHEASAEEKKRILGDTVQEKARDRYGAFKELQAVDSHR